jgi:hypothetical protein
MTGPAATSDTSVNFHQITRCNIIIAAVDNLKSHLYKFSPFLKINVCGEV